MAEKPAVNAMQVVKAVSWLRHFFKGVLSLTLSIHILVFKMVIPRFVAIYESGGYTMPALTQFLIQQSTYWFVYLIFVVLNIVLLYTWKFFDQIANKGKTVNARIIAGAK